MLLQADNITKRYPGVTALDRVSFEIAPGEVVGLIGENGAGKSTLIKVFGGLTQPDEGVVKVDGKPALIHNAAEATQLGIGVIHQELNDLDNIDVAGNVLLGREPHWFGIIRRKEMRREAAEALSRLGIDGLLDKMQSDLSIGQRQMVEIAKSLSLHARVLIMDEPTSSLTSSETDQLLEIVRSLRANGVAVIYISHRLNEVKALADRVVVLRDGKLAGKLGPNEIKTESMVRLMVGRDVSRAPFVPRPKGQPKLVISGLRTTRFPKHEVTFDVRAGEIMGMAGLVGAGRTEVARAVCGMDPRLAGEVRVDGATVKPMVKDAIDCGLYLAPEDRRKEGLVTTMSVRENISLPSVHRMATGTLIQRRREREVAETMSRQLRVKTPSIEAEVSGLSGGNQQKVVLAKWLGMEPKCMVLDEPTRGIDVGARSEIYTRMREMAERGVAIWMISSDLEEILLMSDRVVVMQEGRLTGILEREQLSEESVMALAVGHV